MRVLLVLPPLLFFSYRVQHHAQGFIHSHLPLRIHVVNACPILGGLYRRALTLYLIYSEEGVQDDWLFQAAQPHNTPRQTICHEVSEHHRSIYIPWPFPPVWGVADNTKETTKTVGVSLSSFSNDEGPSRVWMALLEQHSPSSPVFIDILNKVVLIRTS